MCNRGGPCERTVSIAFCTNFSAFVSIEVASNFDIKELCFSAICGFLPTLAASSLFLDILMYFFPGAVFCCSIFSPRVACFALLTPNTERASFHNSCWHSFFPQRMIDLVPIARRPSACGCQRWRLRLWLSLSSSFHFSASTSIKVPSL